MLPSSSSQVILPAKEEGVTRSRSRPTLMRISTILRWISVAALALASGLVFAVCGRSQPKAPNQPASIKPIIQNRNAQIIADGTGRHRLRIRSGASSDVQVGKFGDDEVVGDKLIWSPDGKLLAFEVFKSGGHSPMTTNHVWIVKSDGTGLKEILLPTPNGLYATQLGQWITDTQFRVFGLIPMYDRDVPFIFDYRTDEIHQSR